MTQDGVTTGGSPRDPEPGDAEPGDEPLETEPSPEPPTTEPPAAELDSELPEAEPVPPLAPVKAPVDWLAPIAPDAPIAPLGPVQPPTDWLAPVQTAAPAQTAAPVQTGSGESLASTGTEPIADEEEEELEDGEGEDDEEPQTAARQKVSLAERLKRTPPALVILTLAVIGSSGFLAYELGTRTASIPVLTSALVVNGLAYVIVTLVSAIATYHAATEGREWRSYLLALVGGTAAIVAAGSFAGAMILFLAIGF